MVLVMDQEQALRHAHAMIGFHRSQKTVKLVIRGLLVENGSSNQMGAFSPDRMP